MWSAAYKQAGAQNPEWLGVSQVIFESFSISLPVYIAFSVPLKALSTLSTGFVVLLPQVLDDVPGIGRVAKAAPEYDGPTFGALPRPMHLSRV